jgi:TonB family protein
MRPPHCLLLALVLASGVARAEDSAPALQPPRLVTFVDAEYPSEARENNLSASVELELLVDGDGTVSDARVVTPAGHGFDEAALAAVRGFAFEPARRGTEAVPARIRYRYVFELKPPPAPAPAPEPEPVVAPQTDIVVTSAPEPEVTETAGEYGAVARVRPAPSNSVLRRTIEKTELTSTPGTRGDALRVVELLPGVGRPPMGSGQIIIRGSAPNDSEVFFEGAQVLRLYHFGGLTSFANARLLDHVDMYPGNFSSRFGRKLGGIVDVGARDPATDRFHAVADLNLLDTGVIAEGPVASRWSVAAAIRRSYVDLFFKNLVDADTVLAAPVYDDYQAIVTYRPTDRDRVRLLAYGSRDRLGLVIKDADSDPGIRGDARQATYFHRGQLAWRHRYGETLEQDLEVTAGTIGFGFNLGELSQDIRGPEVFGRAEWRWQAASWARLLGGFDLSYQRLRAEYYGPAISAPEGDPSVMAPLATQRYRSIDTVGIFNRPAAYAELELRPVPGLTVVPGVRADHYSDISDSTISPRLVARYRAGDSTLKMGVGWFSQPPDYGAAVPGLGNPDLRASSAIHYGLGIDQELGVLTLGVEGFHKRLSKLFVNAADGSGLVNDGRGRIYGLEVSAKLAPWHRMSGFLSYTLSRSERSDRHEEWRLFDYDQTHILTAALGAKLPRGWELSGAFRLVSGSPETPVTSGIYDAGLDIYRPVYGPVNSARNPMFRRLDLRVEKQWHPGRYLIALYLDLQNATNFKNREFTRYNYDFTKRGDVNGLPILPSFGVRGEL